MGAVVVGISPDSVKSHKNFSSKNELNFTLLSDPKHEIIEKYGAWKLKKMYERKYMGVERSTFLINPDGHIKNEWRKVKVKGHVEDVKQKLAELK